MSCPTFPVHLFYLRYINYLSRALNRSFPVLLLLKIAVWYRQKNLCMLNSHIEPKRVFQGLTLKSLAVGSTLFMSQPGKKRFLISSSPYLNTIWRTHSYKLSLKTHKYYLIYDTFSPFFAYYADT